MRSYLRKPVPLWLLIVALLVLSTVTTGLFLLPKLFSPRADFQLSLSPSSVQVRREPVLLRSSGAENESVSQLTIKSVNGFLGKVSLSASSPSVVGVIMAESSVLLGSDAATFGLNTTVWMAVAASSLGDYSVNIVGSSGSLTHSISLTVHSRDVRVQTTQQSFSIQQGHRSLLNSLSKVSTPSRGISASPKHQGRSIRAMFTMADGSSTAHSARLAYRSIAARSRVLP